MTPARRRQQANAGRRYGQTPAGRRQEAATSARQVLDTHVTSAYTGVCLGCGRPGPCDEQRAALATIARPAPAWPDPVDRVAGDVAELRSAWLATAVAVDRAGEHLAGVDRAAYRTPTWQQALTDCWQRWPWCTRG